MIHIKKTIFTICACSAIASTASAIVNVQINGTITSITNGAGTTFNVSDSVTINAQLVSNPSVSQLVSPGNGYQYIATDENSGTLYDLFTIDGLSGSYGASGATAPGGDYQNIFNFTDAATDSVNDYRLDVRVFSSTGLGITGDELIYNFSALFDVPQAITGTAVPGTLTELTPSTLIPGTYAVTNTANSLIGGLNNAPSYSFTVDSVTIVPEPSAYAAIFGLAVISFAMCRRRR